MSLKKIMWAWHHLRKIITLIQPKGTTSSPARWHYRALNMKKKKADDGAIWIYLFIAVLNANESVSQLHIRQHLNHIKAFSPSSICQYNMQSCLTQSMLWIKRASKPIGIGSVGSRASAEPSKYNSFCYPEIFWFRSMVYPNRWN